jgi:threonylcarbamoyladenosine tRNA methylthiotransferase CDKAL1
MDTTFSIFIETYGCSANAAESQIIAGILTRQSHEIMKNPENADILIVNTCSVKETTVKKIMFRLMELRKKYPEKKLIATGCLTALERKSIENLGGIIIAGQIGKGSSLEDILAGKNDEEPRQEMVCLPKLRDNEIIDIVPICTGCDSFCSFCATKIAKGRIFSYKKESILSEIDSMKKFGTKEFWLTGQDVSAYGIDIYEKSTLPDLLEAITDSVTGKYFIRIGMLNPKHVSEISNELLKAYRSEKIFKFVHLPVQSGSDSVLRRMNRGHSADDFLEIVNKFRRHFPEITLRTDMIVGFPGETEEDFELSMELLRKSKPDVVNISGFSSHRMTPASGMKQLSTQLKKSRTRKMTELAEEIGIERNKTWVGWKGEVLVDEYKKDKSSLIGRNYAYKPVVIKGSQKLLGTFINVKITDSKPTCLIGEIMQ